MKAGIISVVVKSDKDKPERKRVYVSVNRNKALDEGRRVIGRLLNELTVVLSTGDVKGAEKLMKELKTPPPEWAKDIHPFVQNHKQVSTFNFCSASSVLVNSSNRMHRSQPTKIFVQVRHSLSTIIL